MSGDNSGAGTGTDQKVKDKVIADTYKGEILIPVGRILENQGVFAPRAINADFKVEITFPKADEIMVAQSSQFVAGYKLTELKLKKNYKSRTLQFRGTKLCERKNDSIQVHRQIRDEQSGLEKGYNSGQYES